MFSAFLFILLSLLSVFLILVVLIQRGRGGGLVGALGGAGSQSAFGTKTGDVFTKITIAVAIVWGLLCMLLVMVNRPEATFGGENVRSALTPLPDAKKQEERPTSPADAAAGAPGKSKDGLPSPLTPDAGKSDF